MVQRRNADGPVGIYAPICQRGRWRARFRIPLPRDGIAWFDEKGLVTARQARRGFFRWEVRRHERGLRVF